MSVAPTPGEVFRRAADEGKRLLDQSLLEQVATGFIAGFTIIFGLIALAITHAMAEPQFGEMARVLSALAFAPGVVFLVVGRAELFTENFFDPTATAFERRERGIVLRILRLWAVTFVLNLIGGGLFALIIAVRGVLPPGAPDALTTIAGEIVARADLAAFMSAVIGGALVALLSFLLQAVDHGGSRIAVAYFVGFLLALGPFDHVVVTVLHVFLGMLFGAAIDAGELGRIMLIATAGNLVGGVGLVTLSHVAQAKGEEEAGE